MIRTSVPVDLIGAGLDAGAGRRGCSMGPAAYRVAGIAEALTGLGHPVADAGDLVPEPVSLAADPRLRNLPAVAGWTRAVRTAAVQALGAGRMPVLLGGDHSLSMGSVAAAADHARAAGRALFVLWLDAHSDINTPQSTPSGNLHGCPVAVFLT